MENKVNNYTAVATVCSSQRSMGHGFLLRISVILAMF